MRKPARIVLVSVLAIGLAGAWGVAPAEATVARHYKNCTALHVKYPHGVGLPGAHDHTSGKAVTTFSRNRAVYLANTSLDRDHDKIACEKR